MSQYLELKNINEMVRDLIASGMTQNEIAKAIGRDQATISGILHRKQLDIYYMNGGKKLELLYKKMIKNS